MCLILSSEDAKQLIAKEDIVCYKLLIKIPDFKHGDHFTATIGEIDCYGQISIENNIIYFCTNNKKLEGLYCNDRLGYRYSWMFDNKVKNIFINKNKFLNNTYKFITPYKHFEVKIGETYISDIVKHKNKINNALHSYVNENDIYCNYNESIKVKCIIPKGSTYYLGKFNNKPCYASDTLKYVETLTIVMNRVH